MKSILYKKTDELNPEKVTNDGWLCVGMTNGFVKHLTKTEEQSSVKGF